MTTKNSSTRNKKASSRPGPSPRKQQLQPARLNILFVDPRADPRERIATVLRDLGHQVQPVLRGAEALVLVERERFHLALVYQAPSDDRGTCLLAMLRLLCPWMPVLAHAERPQPSVVARMLLLGVAELLSEPLDAARLAIVIERHVGVRPPPSRFPEEETARLRHILEICQWNCRAAARMAGMGYRSFLERIKALGLR